MFPCLPNAHDVEAALRRHPCVWDVAAVEVTDGHGRLVMAAVVQLAVPLRDPATELTKYCLTRLPATWVPARWVVSGPDDAPGRPPMACVGIPPQAHRAPHLDY
jgi:acyl-CoA synthetase (AMP-forming)/AMP-acid ligase II